MKFWNFDIVFAEFPDETTLAINISECPNRCPGCHSPHLQKSVGEGLTEKSLQALLDRYGRAVTCIGFMGGDSNPFALIPLADYLRKTWPLLRIGWYSGRSNVPENFPIERFDYIKLGPWQSECGPLSSPTTNQRMYRIHRDGTKEDITVRFRRR